MFNSNAVTYLTMTPSQRRTPQRGEDFVTMREHTPASSLSRSNRSRPLQSKPEPKEAAPVSAHEEQPRSPHHHRRHRSRANSQTVEHTASGSRFVKDGLQNLQTYMSTVFGGASTQTPHGYDAQQRSVMAPSQVNAPTTRQGTRMTSNAAAMYHHPSPLPRQTTDPEFLSGSSTHTPGAEPTMARSDNSLSRPRHHHHHHHREQRDGTTAAASAPKASKGVAPGVLVQAVRHMHVHIIRVPASSADEVAESGLANQISPAAVTPSESVRHLTDGSAGLDAVCHELWEQSLLAAGQSVPAVDPTDPAATPMVCRYFMYAVDGTGNASRVEPTNFRGCSVCLKKFKQGEEIGELPCRHVFHLACIHRWLRLKDTCPNCRVTINSNLIAAAQSKHDEEAAIGVADTSEV